MKLSLPKRLIIKGVRRFGYDVINSNERRARDRHKVKTLPLDIAGDETTIFEAIKPFTWTSIDRVISLIHATKYVIQNNIPGDFVECGVWRGGSMMAVALTLQ